MYQTPQLLIAGRASALIQHQSGGNGDASGTAQSLPPMATALE